MLKKYFKFLCVIFVLISCDDNTSAVVQEYARADYTVHQDSILVIRLGNSSGTGYSWQLTNQSEIKRLRLKSAQFVAKEKDLPGSAGNEIWIFEAVAKGVDTFKFVNRRGQQTDSLSEFRNFTVLVH